MLLTVMELNFEETKSTTNTMNGVISISVRIIYRRSCIWIGILVGWNEVSMALFLYSLAYGFGTNGELVNTINIIGAGVKELKGYKEIIYH